jgi:hypothetical protein
LFSPESEGVEQAEAVSLEKGQFLLLTIAGLASCLCQAQHQNASGNEPN